MCVCVRERDLNVSLYIVHMIVSTTCVNIWREREREFTYLQQKLVLYDLFGNVNDNIYL